MAKGFMPKRRIKVKDAGDTAFDRVEHPRPLARVGKSARKRMQRRGQLEWPKRPKREKKAPEPTGVAIGLFDWPQKGGDSNDS